MCTEVEVKAVKLIACAESNVYVFISDSTITRS
jgi:hypothetical protein